jgi:hypothetical protein
VNLLAHSAKDSEIIALTGLLHIAHRKTLNAIAGSRAAVFEKRHSKCKSEVAARVYIAGESIAWPFSDELKHS